jgi:UDPglucose 6-dehydrogenase
MKVVINGTGYVGLTTGAGLAYLGHDVTCIDIDERKIEMLQEGKSPIYEPWLEEIIGLCNGHLKFTTDYAEPIAEADVVFIAVGTPPLPNGSPNLSSVCAAATAVGRHLDGDFTVVVNKSTVPIGSATWVESIVREAFEDRNGSKPKGRFAVTSNPEFLREGSAMEDILYPDRVVVGSNDERATEMLYTLYRPILEQSFTAPSFLPRPQGLGAVPLLATDVASAELIKYGANAFLALKISFINEIGALAEKVGADVTQVARGIGLDSRIGGKFLQAGIGWGGSCFGKDSSALVATAREYGLPMPIVAAGREVNYRQRERVVDKLLAELKILKGRTIGLLGLAFKPNTDDLRDAPAIDLAERLIERGVRVRAHDPIALDRARKEHGDLGIQFCESPEDVAIDSDALVLVTDWQQYREIAWKEVVKTMSNPLLLDARNYLDPAQLERAGFHYVGMGR